MPDRVMLDLETLGTDPGCVILSIGAVRFDSTGLGDEFHESISAKSCQQAGLSIDAGTLEWWLSQDEDARQVLRGGDPLADVLDEFRSWYDTGEEVWAYSPQFDCAILGAAFKAVDMAPPWTYRDERCARTVQNFPLDNDTDHEGTEHDALDDARRQAKMVATSIREVSDDE